MRTVPQIMRSASRVEKLLVISKLKEADSPEAAAALEEIVTSTPESIDPREDLRGQAIGALNSMTTQAAWPILARLAASPDTGTRRHLASALGYSRAAGASSLLSMLASDSSPEVREAAKAASDKLARE